MFLSLKGYSHAYEFTDGCEIKDTEFITCVEFPRDDNCWPIFLSKFYAEYKKRNINPIANMLLLAKYYDIYKTINNTIMDFLKTKTDQQTIDKYMVLL